VTLSLAVTLSVAVTVTVAVTLTLTRCRDPVRGRDPLSIHHKFWCDVSDLRHKRGPTGSSQQLTRA
jgi:hypothetical protein